MILGDCFIASFKLQRQKSNSEWTHNLLRYPLRRGFILNENNLYYQYTNHSNNTQRERGTVQSPYRFINVRANSINTWKLLAFNFLFMRGLILMLLIKRRPSLWAAAALIRASETLHLTVRFPPRTKHQETCFKHHQQHIHLFARKQLKQVKTHALIP